MFGPCYTEAAGFKGFPPLGDSVSLVFILLLSLNGNWGDLPRQKFSAGDAVCSEQVELNHHLADGEVHSCSSGEGVREGREGGEFGEFDVYFEDISLCGHYMSVISSLTIAGYSNDRGEDEQVVMAVLPHQVLDDVEWRVFGCICITADSDLLEMGAVAVRSVELLAEVDDGEIVGPYFAVSTREHFIFCLAH